MTLSMSGAFRPQKKKSKRWLIAIISLLISLGYFFLMVLLPPIAMLSLPSIALDWLVGKTQEIFSDIAGGNQAVEILAQGWLDTVYPQFSGYEISKYPKLYLAESYSFYYYFINEENLITDSFTMSDYMEYFKSTASDTEIMNQLKYDHDFILYDESLASQLTTFSDALLNNALTQGGEVKGDGTVIGNTIAWALSVAADDSHGYCQTHRFGNPEYDCSSFVSYAYKMGGGISKLTIGNTTSMLRTMPIQGFVLLPYSRDKLQRGDIVIYDQTSYGSHTELYIGDNQTVGAHQNIHADGSTGITCDGSASDQRDISGNEISVVTFYDSGWQYILRYTGQSKFEVSQ